MGKLILIIIALVLVLVILPADLKNWCVTQVHGMLAENSMVFDSFEETDHSLEIVKRC